jgi:hypothetical protein
MADAPKSKDAQDREARLAEALRQNLRRRKAQARERDVEAEPPEKEPD